ncbi:MAG: nicotinate (nicotinamide) nucleotide adenylyltransferase [Ferruginibacter sp.]
MNIGLYFGSFNPIHHGHLIIANHILQEGYFRELWFIVSPHNPFKERSSLLNEQHRLRLVQLAIDDTPGMRASNIEFNLPKPSYTTNTLAYLEEKYPKHTFYIVMGSDGFQNIENWKNAQGLLKNCSFIIYKRPGFNIKELSHANIKVVEAPLLEISSTLIRKLIKQKKSIRYLVPDVVMNEIEKQQYYSSSLENPS